MVKWPSVRTASRRVRNAGSARMAAQTLARTRVTESATFAQVQSPATDRTALPGEDRSARTARPGDSRAGSSVMTEDRLCLRGVAGDDRVEAADELLRAQ